jgi:hypothetical protein
LIVGVHFSQGLAGLTEHMDFLLELLGLGSNAEMLWRLRGGFDIVLQLMPRCAVQQA